MTKFRKKPVVIEAVIWQPDQECWENELGALYAGSESVAFWNVDGTLGIETLEGRMTAQPGDYIIKGVKGEFYPCKPDIFAATYEPCLDAEPTSTPRGEVPDA